MCADMVIVQTKRKVIEKAQKIEEAKKEEKCKEEMENDEKFPLIKPYYITWFRDYHNWMRLAKNKPFWPF